MGLKLYYVAGRKYIYLYYIANLYVVLIFKENNIICVRGPINHTPPLIDWRLSLHYREAPRRLLVFAQRATFVVAQHLSRAPSHPTLNSTGTPTLSYVNVLFLLKFCFFLTRYLCKLLIFAKIK